MYGPTNDSSPHILTPNTNNIDIMMNITDNITNCTMTWSIYTTTNGMIYYRLMTQRTNIFEYINSNLFPIALVIPNNLLVFYIVLFYHIYTIFASTIRNTMHTMISSGIKMIANNDLQ